MKEVAIKDICQKDSSSLKQKELLDSGDYPVYGASGIAGYLNTYHQERAYIGIVKDGSGIGRVDFYPEKTSLIGTMQYILPKKGFNIRYIGYCLQSLDLSKYKQGAAIPHIYFRDYGERIVKVTDDENEQLSIVARLDAAFAHIDALKANAEKQLAEARQLFQAELAECMRPKEGWEEKKLKEVAKYSIGLTYKPSDVCENGTIVLRSSNIQEDKLDLADIVRVSCPIKESLYVEKGDILMCSRNGSARLVGKVALIPETEERMTYGTFMMTIRSEFNLYLFNFFKSEDFRNQIKHGEANMINQITRYMLDDVIVNIPPLSAQHSIVSRLDALFANIKKLEKLQQKTLAECDALKQAMLREVFE